MNFLKINELIGSEKIGNLIFLAVNFVFFSYQFVQSLMWNSGKFLYTFRWNKN